MANLQIKSYGLSDTTLEEIFLKVASNIHDGEIVREIQYEDITDHGRLVDHLCFRSQILNTVHRDAFCQFLFRWIYYWDRSKSTRK